MFVFLSSARCDVYLKKRKEGCDYRELDKLNSISFECFLSTDDVCGESNTLASPIFVVFMPKTKMKRDQGLLIYVQLLSFLYLWWWSRNFIRFDSCVLVQDVIDIVDHRRAKCAFGGCVCVESRIAPPIYCNTISTYTRERNVIRL